LAAIAPAAATAQAATPATSDTTATKEDTGLGEIVVTAQRRSENQQSVPIAVTAVLARIIQPFGHRVPVYRFPALADARRRRPGMSRRSG
jgi:hypothetical protein